MMDAPTDGRGYFREERCVVDGRGLEEMAARLSSAGSVLVWGLERHVPSNPSPRSPARCSALSPSSLPVLMVVPGREVGQRGDAG